MPYSVNVIGLYLGSGSPPTGIDNLSLPTFSYDSGDVKLTSDDMAQRTLIQDYEYFREMFTTYRGLPALGLILREYRNPDAQAANGLNTSLTPADFSAVWEESSLESILFPTFVSGPSFGKVGDVYTYTTGGASSTIGHPIQYHFDWGDGTTLGLACRRSHQRRRHGTREASMPSGPGRDVPSIRVLCRNGRRNLLW